MEETKLKIQKRGYKKPLPGDVFAMQLPDDSYIFGKVIVAEAPHNKAPMAGGYLLSFYKYRSDIAEPDYNELTINNFLINPVWTNRQGWTRGYYVTVGHQEADKIEPLEKLCFFSPTFSVFVNGNGDKLKASFNPCAEWTLASYLWIDDHIAEALDL